MNQLPRVAKIAIADDSGHYLLMWRSNHPTFGIDPDLPGGTLEEGESLLETAIREVKEEAGIVINPKDAIEVYSGDDYSAHDTWYALYVVHLSHRPNVTMSWEHSSYEWVSRENFLALAHGAKDTYMHMAHDVIRRYDS